MSACVYVGVNMCVHACEWRSEGILQELSLFFHHVDPGTEQDAQAQQQAPSRCKPQALEVILGYRWSTKEQAQLVGGPNP